MDKKTYRDQFIMQLAVAYMSDPNVHWPILDECVEEVIATADKFIAAIEQSS